MAAGITNYTFARDGYTLYYARFDEAFQLSPDQSPQVDQVSAQQHDPTRCSLSVIGR